VAPISLKNSGSALPAVMMPSLNEEDSNSLYDLEAESELQQIFGCRSGAPGLNLWESTDDVRSDYDDDDDYTSSYPFLALESPGDTPLEFPRLGMSPMSFRQPELEYVLERSRNPVTLNTPFSPKDHLEYQAAVTQSLKLALVGLDYQTKTRNRSFSEPIPFYVE